MKLCVISDTHEKHNKIDIPECDILIHCGDFSMMGDKFKILAFLNWFSSQPARYHIYIAGNHDISYEKDLDFKNRMIKKFDLIYLEHEPKEIEGLKFFGSPYSPEFFNWSFSYERGSLDATKLWNQIPRDTDILITHGPPKNILDRCKYNSPPHPQNAGCEILRHRIEDLNLKYVLFGHIHEGRGMDYYTLSPTVFVNASSCDLRYRPIKDPVILEVYS